MAFYSLNRGKKQQDASKKSTKDREAGRKQTAVLRARSGLSQDTIIAPGFHSISSIVPRLRLFFPSLFPPLNAHAIYHFAC